MLPYLLVLAIAGILGLLSAAWERQLSSRRVSPRTRLFNGFDLVLALVLVAFSGSRVRVGVDYPTYEALFARLRVENWGRSIADSPQESAFTILSLFVKSISADQQAFFWATSALTVVTALIALKVAVHSDGWPLVVFLYVGLAYYVTPFNTVRQGLSASLVLLGVVLWLRARRVSGTIFLVLAVASHASAIFAVFGIVVLWRARPGTRLLALTLLAGVGGAFLMGLLPQLGEAVTLFNDRYDGYLQQAPTGVGAYLVIAFKVALVAYMIWLNSHADDMRKTDVRLPLVLAIAGLGFLVAGTTFKFLSRMEGFFGIFIIVALPILMRGRRQTGVHFIVLTAAVTGYFVLHVMNYGGLVPYRSTLFDLN